ncbi:TRAP transporter substrate-binding protein [Bacillus sp. FJAT-45350]|uniref:TRAP transporter substrate-binding protein n=1 Tax=Bacillus sp. FJAT-45350 TaxID=2011014 RepID=UPI000BB889C6|nr:TRAP transporter substrate-binding protein [Bacillus sp. FJAT-45350]
MKLRIIYLSILLLFVGMLAACGGNETSAPEDSSSVNSNDIDEEVVTVPSYELTLATVVSPPHPWIDMAESFAEEVAEKTNGDVKVTIHHTGTLGNDESAIDEMRLGTVDFVIGGVQNAAPFLPEYQLFSLSYLFENMDHFEAAIAHDSELTQRYQELHEEKGLDFRLLSFAGGGTRNVANSVRPINTPSDLEGLQMRLPGSPLESKIWSELGAVPTSLPWNEIYSALQTGVVSTFESTLSGYKGSNLYEVTDYLSRTEHQFMVSHFSMSLVTIDKLPEDYLDIVNEAAVNAGYLGTEKGNEYDEEVLAELEDLNVEVNEVDKEKFIEILKPLHQELAEDIKAEEVLEIIQQMNP